MFDPLLGAVTGSGEESRLRTRHDQTGAGPVSGGVADDPEQAVGILEEVVVVTTDLGGCPLPRSDLHERQIRQHLGKQAMLELSGRIQLVGLAGVCRSEPLRAHTCGQRLFLLILLLLAQQLDPVRQTKREQDTRHDPADLTAIDGPDGRRQHPHRHEREGRESQNEGNRSSEQVSGGSVSLSHPGTLGP